MTVDKIISAIDAEIARLQQVRKLLANDSAHSPDAKPVAKKRKRKMSTEARAKIAAAQRKRWSAWKKATT
jgi:hypothetical protein